MRVSTVLIFGNPFLGKGLTQPRSKNMAVQAYARVYPALATTKLRPAVSSTARYSRDCPKTTLGNPEYKMCLDKCTNSGFF